MTCTAQISTVRPIEPSIYLSRPDETGQRLALPPARHGVDREEAVWAFVRDGAKPGAECQGPENWRVDTACSLRMAIVASRMVARRRPPTVGMEREA